MGAKLFRWDAGRRGNGSAPGWVAAALLGWVAVGLAAAATGRLEPALPPGAVYETVTSAQLDRITYDDLPGDNEFVSRFAPPFTADKVTPPLAEFIAHLKRWPPGRVEDAGQAARNLLSVAAIADISQDLSEAEIGRAVFDELRARQDPDRLRRILGWIILRPGDGTVVTQAPEFGLRRHPSEALVRERSVLYAKKYLGRLLRKIPD